MLSSTLAKRGCLLLLIAIIAFYFYGLGHLPFIGPDEPRYAQVAREMLQQRDLITPTLGGHTWFEKPILLYWMIGLSFHLIGFTEAAARIGPALAGVFTITAIYWLGKRIERAHHDLEGISCISALMLSSMPGMIVFARGASFDILVTMTLTWSLAMFLAAQLEDAEPKRRWLYVGFYLFMGLSLLAKGLIGIVLPFIVISVFQLFRWSFPDKKFLTTLLWGLPLALAVSAIWYGPVIARHGWPFVDEFFLQHHFARYVSNKYHHPQPFFYYFLIIFPLSLPWLPFAIPTLGRLGRRHFRDTSKLNLIVAFASAWLVAPLFFFSFSTSKLPGYLIPVVPAVALLATIHVKIGGDEISRATRVVGAFLVAIGIGGLFYAKAPGTISLTCGFLIVTPLLLSGSVPLIRPEKRRLVVLLVAAAVPLSFLAALNCDVPELIERRSPRYLLELADARGFQQAPLYSLHEVDRGIEFYAAGRIAYDGNGEPIKFEGAFQVFNEAQRLQQPVLVIVPVKYVYQLRDLDRAVVEVISDNGELAMVLVRSGTQ